MNRLYSALLAGVSLLGCQKVSSGGAAHASVAQDPVNLSVSQVAEILKNDPQVQLVDVRTGFEWNRGYIAGAKHIPVGDIKARMNEIDPNRPVLLYCAAGGRSHHALEILQEAGYKNVRHMADGISGWKAAGMPTTK
ncbi:MAG TPA: rhodanese-like domain-containing protein [Pseudomonadota bacterium]|jgi:adenylyltransferase/sulfurtransferase|nr:rhodanese-like domain-containing protein [Pseudomonadota bacterium]